MVGRRNVILAEDMLDPFSRDKSYFNGKKPIAVIKPKNSGQISKVLMYCTRTRTKVMVHGAGSSLTGSSVPLGRTVVIDMSGFNRILETHLEDEYVIVEPGVTIGKLNEYLARYNYFYPPDPASAAFASIGGSISTNAGGLRAVMYGSTKIWILGLEVVLPTGEIVQTGGRTLKRSVGYDFTSLIVGSEGTLGVVTKAILKVIPKPEKIARIVAYFKKMDQAVAGVYALKRNGVTLIGAEYLDKSSMGLLRRYRGLGFPDNADCMLLIDIASTKESVWRVAASAERLLRKSGAIRIDSSKSERGMERLYAARRSLYEVARELAQGAGRDIFISDVIVPTSELEGAVKEINSKAKEFGFQTELFSHIGDGNIHVNVIANKAEISKVERMLMGFAQIALAHKGSISGEHGIGLEKKDLLIKELKAHGSISLLGKMKRIKSAFDPSGVLNPGKVFD